MDTPCPSSPFSLLNKSSVARLLKDILMRTIPLRISLYQSSTRQQDCHHPFLATQLQQQWAGCSNSTGTTTGWRQYHAQCKGAGPGTNERYKMLSCPPHLIQRCEFLNNSSRGWKISTRRLLIYMEVSNTNSKIWTQTSSGLPYNLSFYLLFIPHSIEREVDYTPGSCDTSTQETQTTTTNRTHSHLKLTKNPIDLFTVWKEWEFCLDWVTPPKDFCNYERSANNIFYCQPKRFFKMHWMAWLQRGLLLILLIIEYILCIVRVRWLLKSWSL